MNALVLTHPGMEHISAEEVTALLSERDVQKKPGLVLFEATDQELARLTYHGRTFLKVMSVLKSGTNIDDLYAIEIPDVERMTVTCDREGEHSFTSQEVRDKLIAIAASKGKSIDRKRPQLTMHVVIRDKEWYAGIDFSGIDLGTRDYRVFLGAQALKGTIAAGALLFAEYKSGKTLIDPFCRHGVIPIEAALMATNTSPQKFVKDKLAFTQLPRSPEVVDDEKEFSGKVYAIDENFKHLSSARKNAKIATMHKNISFSKYEVEFLDAKFEEYSVDCIVTFPIQPSRLISEEKAAKVYEQLIDQAKFLMRPGSCMVAIMTSGTELLKKSSDIPLESFDVMMGKQKITFVFYHF